MLESVIVIKHFEAKIRLIYITLQLYIRYDWADKSANENSDTLGSAAAWRENYVEIVGPRISNNI